MLQQVEQREVKSVGQNKKYKKNESSIAQHIQIHTYTNRKLVFCLCNIYVHLAVYLEYDLGAS